MADSLFNREKGLQLGIPFGLNAGSVVAGVVGRSKFIYELWGDTVALAKTLSGQGAASIYMSQSVYDRLQNFHHFAETFPVVIRGKGAANAWKLVD